MRSISKSFFFGFAFLPLSVVSLSLSPFRLLSTSPMIETAQYASEAASLFNNMKTPTTLLVGAMVPIALMAPLEKIPPPDQERVENRFETAIRRAYPFVAVMSLLSELTAVIWATVAVNKLTETAIAPADSVWHLLKRDFDLPWSAVNAHFFMGMLGFAFLVGSKAYFQSGGGLMGQSIASVAVSSLCLMAAIFNRGIALGSGDGLRYGASVIHLLSHYMIKLVQRATNPKSFGPLETTAILLLVFSTIQGVRAIITRSSVE